MSRVAATGALLAAATLFLGVVFAQTQADRVRPTLESNELLYLPNEKLLSHFTCGMDTVIADLLWIQCIQYTAHEAKGERNFTWLNHMLNTVARLDPHFVDVYRYGGMFLSALKADSNAGLELLEHGMIKNPSAWELPYEAAMVYLLNRKDDPDSRQHAAYYLSMSAATGNAPTLIRDLAAKLQGEFNLLDIEREMWRNLLESEDELLRDTARRKLEEVKLREACNILNDRIQAFTNAAERSPASLEELVESGLLSALPPDPLGGQYFINVNGKAQNTTLLDGVKEQHANLIQEAAENYKEAYGAWPESLEALVQGGFFTQLPPHPYAGEDWTYDPATGKVN